MQREGARLPHLPKLWREDPTPEAHRACSLCPLAQQRSRIIWGEGNPDARIIVLLDNPGAREDKLGEPFVCGTRQALYTATAKAGLGENDLYVTYVLRCRPRKKYDKELARSTCLGFLHEQIAAKHPKLLVCLGNVAAQAYLENNQAEIKNLRGKITMHNGIATAFSYHPLAIRRRPNLQPLFEADWQLVADYYRRI
ncbi:MAG TPA: uracil-DNA glycosylase [Firmicutes bacterium]|nr:uracil-DNA glycosylase [Bacillota bacterium]